MDAEDTLDADVFAAVVFFLLLDLDASFGVDDTDAVAFDFDCRRSGFLSISKDGC